MHIYASYLDLFFRLLVAALLGALVGLEREYFGKAAGFRTHALVSVASCLIMEVSTRMFELYRGQAEVDPSRIAAQVVSGIGFIGAGAIIRSGASVRGITTAASLWAVSAIGLACGMHFYSGALFTTAIVLIILVIFTKLEAKLIRGRPDQAATGGSDSPALPGGLGRSAKPPDENGEKGEA